MEEEKEREELVKKELERKKVERRGGVEVTNSHLHR